MLDVGDSYDTAKVEFTIVCPMPMTEPKFLTCWLPTHVLTDVRQVMAPSIEELEPAVVKHDALSWDPKLKLICGSAGFVFDVDNFDGTSEVKFETTGLTCWLPTEVLSDIVPRCSR